MENISKRLRQIVDVGTQEVATRRFNWLANNTSVSAEAWRSFWNGKQKPSAEMIESAAKLWPEHAYWLVTDMDDSDFGHSAPREIGFPEKSKVQQSSVDYFAAVNAFSLELDNFPQDFIGEKDIEISQESHDLLKRNQHNLVDANEPISKNKLKVKFLRDVRWIEILIDVFLPKLGYVETESMLEIARNKLKQVEQSAKEHGIELNNQSVRVKISDLDTQIAKYHAWNASVNKSPNVT